MEDDTFNDSADMDDDDGEEIPRTPKAAKAGAKNGAKNGAGKPATSAKDSERKKRELITMGKAKGFLTYDEVNEHMPENIVSSDQMDDWLSAFSGEGIEIVDSSSKLKVTEKGEAEAEEEDEDVETTSSKKEDAEEEEDIDGYSKTNDPVRMYLRKMGSVSLLTREGEVEIAKRIEDGERKMLQAVLNSSVAVEELLEIGERLRKGKIRVKDVVKDIDEDEAEFNEQFYVDRVCKIIDKVRKLQRDTEKLEEKLDEKGASAGRQRRVKEATKANRAQMFEELSDLRLNKPTVDRIVAQLKNIIIKLDKAEAEAKDCERRVGMGASEIRKT